MRILSTLATISSLAYGYYWVEHNHPSWKKKALAMVGQSQFNTLESPLYRRSDHGEASLRAAQR